jgi:hypothetical protein
MSLETNRKTEKLAALIHGRWQEVSHKTWHSSSRARKNREIKTPYIRIIGVLAHPVDSTHEGFKLCWSKWLSQSISITLGWNDISFCVTQLDLSGFRPTAAIMSPSLAAVSTVRERRAFTSSIAVYSSCLMLTQLQLLKRISVRVLSSTGTSTSTSTRLLQVPRISSMSPCVYFTVIRSQRSAAVHCCL